MRRSIFFFLVVCLGIGVITACSPRQFTTVTIYDTPAAFVRLEFDRTVKTGREHSHPISLTPQQVAAVLGGVIVHEPNAFIRGDIFQRNPVPRVHPAFSDKDIAFFAPLLALALSKATPEEVVTFYQTRDLSVLSREVTSGGLFVQGDQLHLILANYRSSTRYMADTGVAETEDDRLTPMQSLSPQRSRLDFEPHSAKWEQQIDGLEKVFQQDNRKLIVLYKQLEPRPLVEVTP